MGEEARDLEPHEFPEVLQEFDEIKEIMKKEEVTPEKAFAILKEKKGSSALDDFSPEAIKAFMGIARVDEANGE